MDVQLRWRQRTFIGDVNLCIDGAAVCKLNDMWSMISNVYSGDEKKIKNFENSGNVGSKGTIILNSEVVGNAQFRKAQKIRNVPIIAILVSGPLLSLNSLSTIRFLIVPIL